MNLKKIKLNLLVLACATQLMYVSPIDAEDHTQQALNSHLGVTYNFSGGRLGDNLVSYFHAKWISLKYGIPLIYKPFPLANYFQFSEMEMPLGSIYFEHEVYLDNIAKIGSLPSSSLITLPYFPEGKLEIFRPEWVSGLYFAVDWNDPTFKHEIQKCLSPTRPFETLELPTDCITVAVHVRRGGDTGEYESLWRDFPLKFPPDSYYIEQLTKLGEFFQDQQIYVHFFTDHRNPQELIAQYSQKLQNSNMTFGYGSNNKVKGFVEELFHDFYSIPKFDCLIGCESNFSFMASHLGDYLVKVMPINNKLIDDKNVIDQVDIIFKANWNKE